MSLLDYERFVFAACHVATTRTTRPSTGARLASGSARCGTGCSSVPASFASSAPTPTSASASRGARGSRLTATTTCPTARSSRARSRPRRRARSATRSPPSTTGARSRTCGCASRAAGSSRPRPRAGDDYLRSMLDIDGARVLGEIAFGLNYEIDRFTRNILFDEKIGGTIHLAIGAGFPQAAAERVGPALGHDLRPPRGRRDLRRRRADLEGGPLPGAAPSRERAWLSPRVERLAASWSTTRASGGGHLRPH